MTAIRVAAFFALAAAAAFTGASAQGGPPESWTRLTPTRINFAEVGIARGADGALHVVWAQDDGALESLRHQAILAGGRPAGRSTSIASGWRSLNASPDLAVAPDGRLHAVFAGQHSLTRTDPLNGPLHTAEGSSDGASWSGPRRTTDTNAGPDLSVGVARDGTVVVAHGGATGLYRFVGESNPQVEIEMGPCCVRGPRVASDGASGQVVLGWYRSPIVRQGGFYAQPITRTGFAGARQLAPDSSYTDQRTAITGRLCAPGVFLAYRSRDRGTIRLWRYGSSSAKVVARGEDLNNVGISAVPEGRLWVFWERGERYYATRSNRAATRFGEVLSVAPPRGTLITTYGLFGEGSNGPLDLLAHVQTGPGRLATWHTQLLPRLALACTSGRPIRCRVSDVGDAVSKARVQIGERTLLTNAQGRISVHLPAGTYRAVASKAGYAPASVALKGVGG